MLKKNYWNNILWLLSTSKNIEEVKCFCRSCSGIGISNGILYLASDAASDYDLKILRQQKTNDNNSTRHTRSSRIKQKRPSEELFFSTSLVRVFYNQMEWHSFASFSLHFIPFFFGSSRNNNNNNKSNGDGTRNHI